MGKPVVARHFLSFIATQLTQFPLIAESGFAIAPVDPCEAVCDQFTIQIAAVIGIYDAYRTTVAIRVPVLHTHVLSRNALGGKLRCPLAKGLLPFRTVYAV